MLTSWTPGVNAIKLVFFSISDVDGSYPQILDYPGKAYWEQALDINWNLVKGKLKSVYNIGTVANVIEPFDFVSDTVALRK